MEDQWIILTEWYWPENKERRAELTQCLHENVESPEVRKIVLFSETMEGLDENTLASSKIIIKPAASRPTFKSLVMYASGNFENNRIAIINNDISFKHFKNFKPDIETVYCISRYEIEDDSAIWFDDYQQTNGSSKSHSASQDAWLFQSGIKLRGGGFCLGIPGCDNRIAWLFKESGNTVINNGKKICLVHRHESQIRNRSGESIPSPYLFLDIDGTKIERFYPTLPYYQFGRNPFKWHFFRSLTMSSDDFWLTIQFVIRTKITLPLTNLLSESSKPR
mgnify:CR=1 FL=1